MELGIYLALLLRFLDPTLSITVRITQLYFLSIACIVLICITTFHVGVELHDDVIEHCKTSIAKWKTAAVEDRNEGPTFHFVDATADIHIIKGNGLNILTSQGEGVVGFDRIYIGAAVDKEDLANIIELLSPGGILVGPGK